MPQRITIKHNGYTAEISTSGAELKSVTDHNGTEFMWQADADIWPRTAPVLFPIVGKVKNDQLRVNGTTYGIGQHGFARDKVFAVTAQTESSVSMQLIYDEDTLRKYPFDFKLTLRYAWMENELVCSYEVENAGASDMPFSIGAHPGFNIPDGHLENYVLKFEKPETAERHLLEDGLFNRATEPVLNNENVLPLNATFFDKDALVFKNLKSNWIELQHTTSAYAVKMKFSGFPHFGIWSKKGTQRFVCLEPWFGHSDYQEGHTDFTTKEGVQLLKSHEKFNAEYRLEFRS